MSIKQIIKLFKWLDFFNLKFENLKYCPFLDFRIFIPRYGTILGMVLTFNYLISSYEHWGAMIRNVGHEN